MLKDAEALVIGGGPVGLFAALSLVERGVSVQVLDAFGERAVRGYACGLHPDTLRIFDRVGLMPAILETAHRVDRLVVRDGSAIRGTAEFTALEGKYPYVLTLRQFNLEDILRQSLARRDSMVLRHHSVTQLYPRHRFVNVTGKIQRTASTRVAGDIGRPGAEFFERKADYVIGADGYFSICRRALGLELTPVRPTRAFAVCEFNADLAHWEREACLTHSADSVCAFWPLGPQLGRFTFQISRRLDETVSLEMLRELLRERAPWFTPNPEQLCWGAVAPFEHALTQRFGQGRIWLAGDAAHSTSPVGFQSMNRGFCEAERLSSAIASDLFDTHPDERQFQHFESEQQAEWIRLFGLWPHEASTRWQVSELAPCIPASGDDFDVLLEQLGAATNVSRSIF
jgi:2-polyprenyl-6-methoxyphenol hydroxylase-like FAD-dependent oxidoreductase